MNKQKFSTRDIVLCGILIAISIVLTRMFAFMLGGGTIRISFGNVPIALAGILLGGAPGFLVGAIADVLGVMILSQGTPHIGFTLSSALQGLIPALVLHKAYYDKKTSNQKLFVLVTTSIVLSSLVVSIGLDTLWLSQLFSTPFLVLLPSRLPARAIIGIGSIVIIYILLLKLKDKINKNL